jgi:hypothetical protein
MAKLYPILANPNAPSLFTGLDVSLVAGQMTALDGGDSFSMTASTLTANASSASWADIVAVANAPPASVPTLQSVLEEGNSANGADASITLLGGVDDLVTASLSNSQLVLTDAPHSSSLSAVEQMFSGATASGVFSEVSVTFVDTDVDGSLSATALALNTATDAMSMSASALTANASSATWADIIAVANAPPASAPTLQSVLDEGNSASGADASISLSDGGLTSSFSPSLLEMIDAVPTTKVNMSSTAFRLENASGFASIENPTGFLASYTSGSINASSFLTSNAVRIQQFDVPSGAVLATQLQNNGLFINSPENVSYNVAQYNILGMFSQNTTATVRCRALDGFSNTGRGANLGLSSRVTQTEVGVFNTAGAGVLNATNLVMRNTSYTQYSDIYNYGVFVTNSTLSQNAEMRSANIKVSSGSENANLTKDGLVVTGTSPTETTTITTDRVAVASATHTGTLQDTEVFVSSSSSAGSLTETRLRINDIPNTFVSEVQKDKVFISDVANSKTMSLEVNKILSSGGDFSVEASGAMTLKAGADTFKLSSGGMISSSAGGFFDKYLVVTINGVEYKIALLAPS